MKKNKLLSLALLSFLIFSCQKEKFLDNKDAIKDSPITEVQDNNRSKSIPDAGNDRAIAPGAGCNFNPIYPTSYLDLGAIAFGNDIANFELKLFDSKLNCRLIPTNRACQLYTVSVNDFAWGAAAGNYNPLADGVFSVLEQQQFKDRIINIYLPNASAGVCSNCVPVRLDVKFVWIIGAPSTILPYVEITLANCDANS